MSQSWKDKYCYSTYKVPRIIKCTETKQDGGCQELREEGNGDLLFNVYIVSAWEDRKVLGLMVMMVA